MPFRSILLRVLFWSLAVAAVFGAIAMLTGSPQTTWRVTGSAVATAVASFFLFLACAAIEKPAARPAGLLAATLIVIEYLLLNLAVWFAWLWASSTSRDSVWLTILFLALVGFPAVAFMRATRTEAASLAGWIGLILCVIELALLLWIAWDNVFIFESMYSRIASLLPVYGIMMVICLIGKGGGAWRFARWGGAILSGGTFAVIVYGILEHFHSGGRTMIYLTAACAFLAHANILMLCTLRPSQAWLRWITLAAAAATAFFVAASIDIHSSYDDSYTRWGSATGLIAGCGTLAILILARLNRGITAPAAPLQSVRDITLFCPVCSMKQTLAVGSSACVQCRAVFQIRIEEPKCATCGYSLLMLRSGVCPECGTPIGKAFAGASLPQSDQPVTGTNSTASAIT